MRNLNIVFMGTPEFAVPSLEILVKNNLNVVAVVTAPDKPAGRGLKLQTSAVKDFAVAHNLPVLQPTNLKSEEFLNELKSYHPNLQIVVAFRMLPEAIWKLPEYGTFNLHASLLPAYRGAAPINWAIINGEKETGLTTFFLKHEIDTGDVILQQKEPINPDDTVGTLYERLMQKGAGLVLKSVEMIREGNYTLTSQDKMGEVKHAPKIFKETCRVNFEQPAEKVYNFIRGLSPYPAAWTELNGKNCKIYTAKPIDKMPSVAPGQFETDGKTFLHFAAQDAMLAVEELQLEGKKKMQVEEFLRGNRL